MCSAGYCTATCTTSADCGAGQVCAGGLCADTCETAATCNTDRTCSGGVCLPTCTASAECVTGPGVARTCIDSVCEPTTPPGRLDPGEGRLVDEGDRVTLDARGSFAYDAAATTIRWEQLASNPKGVIVALEATKADAVEGPVVSFEAPTVVSDTDLLFRATMTDGDGNEATGDVTITVRNSHDEPPVIALVEAGPNPAAVGDEITVMVDASDPNPGDALTYAFDVAVDGDVTVDRLPDGEDPSKARYAVSAASGAGTLTFTARVSDGEVEASGEASVEVQGSSDPCAGVDCVDANPCTDDACDTATGCVSTPNTAACDVGSACTSGDACVEGSCAGAPLACDDGDVCTDDGCDPATGCTATPNTAACDDGDACTTGDICALGTCIGEPMTCDDANPCTKDACDSGLGCIASPIATSCDDGSACTQGDKCVEGTCMGSPVLCADDDPCTLDTCDLALGCVFPPAPDGLPCDDGDLCTVVDTCLGGLCASAPPPLRRRQPLHPRHVLLRRGLWPRDGSVRRPVR